MALCACCGGGVWGTDESILRNAAILVWLRNGDVIDFVGLWEQLSNPNFNSVEFDLIKTHYRRNAFTMSPKQWISRTNAIGLIS